MKLIKGNSKNSIVINKDDFNKLQNDNRFHLILMLTRILNSIRFSQSASVRATDDTPAASRDSMASFLYMCSLLYESFENIYPLINKEFHHLSSFQNGLMILFNNKNRKKYHDTVFKKARNHITFHFEKDSIKKSINIYKVKEEGITFAETHSDKTGDMYFHFSDELVYNYLMGISRLDDKSSDKFITLIKNVADISREFIRESEKLIIEAIEDIKKRVCKQRAI